MLASAAAVTRILNLGTLVFNVDHRHPVVYAKMASSMHLLSGGRFEFGIGAGWSRNEYEMTGIRFDEHEERIERLDEALFIIRSLWMNDNTSYTGKHYKITNMNRAAELQECSRPKIMVGGGGKRILTVAGRHADIVGIHFSVPEGSVSGKSFRDSTYTQVKRRVEWVRNAATKEGRDPDDIEYQIVFNEFEITEDPSPVLDRIGEEYGISAEDVKACPHMLVGSHSAILEKLITLREETGISYMVLASSDVRQFDEFAISVIKSLLNYS